MRKMNYGLLIGVLTMAVALAGCTAALDLLEETAPINAPATPYVFEHDTWFDGQVLVGFDNDIALNQIVNELGGQVSDRLDVINTAIVTLPADVSVR